MREREEIEKRREGKKSREKQRETGKIDFVALKMKYRQRQKE